MMSCNQQIENLEDDLGTERAQLQDCLSEIDSVKVNFFTHIVIGL